MLGLSLMHPPTEIILVDHLLYITGGGDTKRHHVLSLSSPRFRIIFRNSWLYASTYQPTATIVAWPHCFRLPLLHPLCRLCMGAKWLEYGVACLILPREQHARHRRCACNSQPCRGGEMKWRTKMAAARAPDKPEVASYLSRVSFPRPHVGRRPVGILKSGHLRHDRRRVWFSRTVGIRECLLGNYMSEGGTSSGWDSGGSSRARKLLVALSGRGKNTLRYRKSIDTTAVPLLPLCPVRVSSMSPGGNNPPEYCRLEVLSRNVPC